MQQSYSNLSKGLAVYYDLLGVSVMLLDWPNAPDLRPGSYIWNRKNPAKPILARVSHHTGNSFMIR